MTLRSFPFCSLAFLCADRPLWPEFSHRDRKDRFGLGHLPIRGHLFPRVSPRGSPLVTGIFTQRSQRSQRSVLDQVTFRSPGHFVPSRSSPWIVPRDRNFHTEIAKVAKMGLIWSPFDPVTISFPRVPLRGSSLVTGIFTQTSQRSQRWV
jgi:hypothetical protein